MRIPFLSILAATWAVAGIAVGAEEGQVLDQLQGSWEVVKADPPSGISRFTFRGDTMAPESKDPRQLRRVFHIHLDPAARPATIDLLAGEEMILGIYEMNGDTLKLCLGEKGAKRPAPFAAAKGVVLVVLKRVHGPRVLTLEYALGLLPEASSISNADFRKLSAASGAPPDTIKSQSLSLVLLSSVPEGVEKNPQAKKDFRSLVKGTPTPGEIAAALSLSQQKGYVSVLQPEYITQASVEAGEDKAQGTVSFRCQDLYEGTVGYRAEKQESRWVITEFRLPHYGIRVVRNREGVWERGPIPPEK
ncbi:MAG: TIGR03067 domain-containing protein [Planctomycetes bacterium]|nr:TIGR03067 domain-containing protein [Planctomycetota bacterium]